MSIPLSTAVQHRIFTGATLFFFGLFLAFLGYLYIAFSGALIGDVRSDITPDLIKGLQSKKFETAVGRLEARKSLPDIPPDLPNPFNAPSR